MKVCPDCTFQYDETQHRGCPLCSIAREGEENNGGNGGGAPEPAEPLAEDIGAEEPPVGQLGEDEGGEGQAGEDADLHEPRPHPDAPREKSILEELDALRESGVFTVALVGFFVGGKTWFLNRLKYELDENMGYDVDPEYARPGRPVERTNRIEIHHVRRFSEKQGDVEVFAIVDIPGENLYPLIDHDYLAAKEVIAAIDLCGALIVALPSDEVILSEQVTRDMLERGSPEIVLAKLAEISCDKRPHEADSCTSPLCRVARDARQLCRKWGSAAAFLLRNDSIIEELGTLRAQLLTKQNAARPAWRQIETLAARIEALENEREALLAVSRIMRLNLAHEDLQGFTRHLGSLTGLMSLLAEDGRPVTSDYPFETITKDRVNQHINASGRLRRFSRPMFVALTKADLIAKPDALTKVMIERRPGSTLSDMFDLDPLDTVRQYRKGFPAKLKQWFKYTKIDFVTAFNEHSSGDTVINYQSAHYGIKSVFGWIFWAQDLRDRGRRETAALDRAVRLRDLRDGAGVSQDLRIPARRRAS
jgi:hypothetical protein